MSDTGWSSTRTIPSVSALLAPHTAWVLPPLLQLTACVHGIYQPSSRAQLAPGLLAMPPAERAIYLRQSNTAAKVRGPVLHAAAAPLCDRHACAHNNTHVLVVYMYMFCPVAGR